MRERTWLSFVVPAYNLGGWENDCLGSLVAQTCQVGWETIFVDDGSTDGTGANIDAWARKASWLRVIHQPNAGVNPARQRGIFAARGHYAWCVDGDDVLHPQAVAVVQEAIVKRPDVELWVVGETIGRGVSGKVQFMPLVWTEESSMEVASCELGTVMIRFTIFLRHLGCVTHSDNLMVGEDILFAQRMLVRARKVGKIALPLYGYQMRLSSVIHTPSVKQLHHSIAFHRVYLPFQYLHRAQLNVRCIHQSETAFFFRLPRQILRYRGMERAGLVREWFAVAKEVGRQGSRRLVVLSRCTCMVAWSEATRLALLYVNAWIFRYGAWRARQRQAN